MCIRDSYETEGHYEVVFRKEDHMRLRDTLKACRGKWMVSYNDCDFIRELYDGYYITAVTRLNNLAQRYEGGCEFPEVIIKMCIRDSSGCLLSSALLLL